MSALKYRSDIDGLRALAVVPVLLFHAGVTGFGGGFVGVDVFFVISGYLITSIIVREIDQGSFSIVRFYERRVRRIFPALFAVIAFACIVAPFALLPSELRTLANEVYGALAFVANIVFWRAADYFATSAEQKPLLHTWSLGVEEQFYIFTPIAIWIIARYARKALLPITILLLITSFAACIYFTPIKPSASFYLLPFRAWELLVGSILALGMPRHENRNVNELLSLTGVVALLYSIFFFTEETSFPGYAAALPVVGAALIIQFAENSIVGRLLSCRTLVTLGLISYSLYLWHWPIVVFFRDWGLIDSSSGKLSVVFLSTLVAWLSWKFVETPFRNPKNWPREKIFKFAASGVVTLLVTAFIIDTTNGLPNRLTSENLAFDNAREDISPERGRCHIGAERSYDKMCRLGVTDGAEPKTLVWADSHGVEIAAALAEQGLPLIQDTFSSCPPALDVEIQNRPDCKKHNDAIIKEIESSETIEIVILAANYIGYSQVGFWDGIQKTIDRIRATGVRVVLLGPLPNFEENIPSYLASGRRESLEMLADPKEFKKLTGDITVVSMQDTLCPTGQCPLIINGSPILFDDSHLSMTAARNIARDIMSKILNAPQGSRS